MSTNNKKLPRDYSVRVACNSDIWKIFAFYFNEFFQSTKGILTFTAIIALPLISTFFAAIINSFYLIFFVAALSYIVSVTSTCFIVIYCVWTRILKSKECLVIYDRKKICAVLVAFNYSNYSYIKILFVGSRYRRKGLAKCLMQSALNHFKYPIYLLSTPKMHLFDLYTSLGFVFIKENQLPKELKKHLSRFVKLFPMIIEER